MKRVNGVWYYRGQSYATLYEALAAVWPQALPSRAGERGAAPGTANTGGGVLYGLGAYAGSSLVIFRLPMRERSTVLLFQASCAAAIPRARLSGSNGVLNFSGVLISA